MEDKVRSWQLVEHFLDASVSPERVDELIAAWDAQMERAGMSQPRLAEFARVEGRAGDMACRPRREEGAASEARERAQGGAAEACERGSDHRAPST